MMNYALGNKLAGIPCMHTTCKVCVFTFWQDTALSLAQRPTENVALICDSSLTSLAPSPLATTSHSVETECKYCFDGQYNVALKHLQDWFTDSHTSEIVRQWDSGTPKGHVWQNIVPWNWASAKGHRIQDREPTVNYRRSECIYKVGLVMDFHEVPCRHKVNWNGWRPLQF